MSTYDDAKQFNNIKMLHDSQRQCVEFILQEVFQIAAQEIRLECEAASTDAYRKEQHFRRPHQVFVINGKRGTGKTTALITAYHHLELLGALDGGRKDPRVETLAALELDREIGGRIKRRGTLIIPIIMPNELADNESVMENLFAQIEVELLRVAKAEGKIAASRRGQAPQVVDDQGQPASAITADSLINDLHNKIGVGWTYSQRIGMQALVNDSLNYSDYVERRAEQARISYTRVDEWRSFVNNILDYLGSEVMVICIDDSDLSPHVCEDILHTLRMYLSHPRIVTLLAIDLETLINGIEKNELSHLNNLSSVLTQADKKPEIKVMRSLARRSVRDYVHKVLPIGLRRRLLGNEEAFNSLFYAELKMKFDDFLEKKVNVAIEKLARGSDESPNHYLINLIFWNCLLKNKAVIYSESIREMIDIVNWCNRSDTFLGDLTASFMDLKLAQPSTTDCADYLHPPYDERQLNKVIFESKLQFVFMNDVECKISDANLENGDEQYNLIQFIIRLELARNNLKPPDWFRNIFSKFIQAPHPAQNLLPYQATFGVSSVLANALVPRNCLYLDELRPLLRNEYFLTAHVMAKQFDWIQLLETKYNKDDLSRLNPGLAISPESKMKNALWSAPDANVERLTKLAACFVLSNLMRRKIDDKEQLNTIIATCVNSPLLQSNSPDNLPFINFIQKAQMFLRQQSYTLDAINGIIVNALIVAGLPITDEDKIKDKEDSDVREKRLICLLDKLVFALKNDESSFRTRVLLVWAVIPCLPSWLEINGIRNEKIWDNIKNVILAFLLNKKFLQSADRWREFPEFTEEQLETINNDLLSGQKELAKLLKNKASLRVFSPDKEFFGLDNKQQIAYLLNTTPIQAKAFIEYVDRA